MVLPPTAIQRYMYRKMDRTSKSDPFVVIKSKTESEANWREMGELLDNSVGFH